MVTESEIYFVADFHSTTLPFDAIVLRGIQSRLLFSCGLVDLPNHQFSKLTQFLDINRSVYQLNCNEVTVVRHDITCDIFNLLNHSFSSAFS